MITSLYILGLCKARTACSNNGCLTICYIPHLIRGFPDGSVGKESTYNVGDLGLIPGLGRFPGEGKGYPLQYSCLENSMNCRGHGVAKSQTRLVAQRVKNLPAMWETWVQSLGWEDPLEEGMATHSSILA